MWKIITSIINFIIFNLKINFQLIESTWIFVMKPRKKPKRKLTFLRVYWISTPRSTYALSKLKNKNQIPTPVLSWWRLIWILTRRKRLRHSWNFHIIDFMSWRIFLCVAFCERISINPNYLWSSYARHFGFTFLYSPYLLPWKTGTSIKRLRMLI